MELLNEYTQKQSKIDADLAAAMAVQQKTYLHGLDIRVKTLEEKGDTIAADKIKQEMEKVKDDPRYFSDMMIEANK